MLPGGQMMSLEVRFESWFSGPVYSVSLHRSQQTSTALIRSVRMETGGWGLFFLAAALMKGVLLGSREHNIHSGIY